MPQPLQPSDCLAALCRTQADDADVERLKKERAGQGPAVAAEPLPERFYKLPRIRFLLLLCKELARINRHISKVRGTGNVHTTASRVHPGQRRLALLVVHPWPAAVSVGRCLHHSCWHLAQISLQLGCLLSPTWSTHYSCNYSTVSLIHCFETHSS